MAAAETKLGISCPLVGGAEVWKRAEAVEFGAIVKD